MTIARTSASGFAIAAASASPTGPIDANTDSKQYSRSSDGSRIAMDRQLARPSQYPWFEPWSTYTTREDSIAFEQQSLMFGMGSAVRFHFAEACRKVRREATSLTGSCA